MDKKEQADFGQGGDGVSGLVKMLCLFQLGRSILSPPVGPGGFQ